MVGEIYIKGDIGSYTDESGKLVKGYDLTDLMADVSDLRKQGATSFLIKINSLGGFCDDGFSMYNFLKTIQEPIETWAVEQCASIATVIFLAGGKRKAFCPLMIHNPWISNVSGDWDQVQEAADIIKAEEEKLISFYSKITGLEKGALDDLMKRETYIYPDLALRLGFTTEQTEQKNNQPVAYKAVAKLKENMSNESKTLIKKITELINKVSGEPAKPKALMVTDESGVSMEILSADGTELSGMPVDGNMVMIDGNPASGTYVLPEMSISITVADGIITEVTELAVEDKALEMANKKIEELTKENSELKASLEESKEDIKKVTDKVTEFEGLLAKMKGASPDVQAKQTFRKTEEAVDASKDAKAKLDARREEIKKKREGIK